MREDTQPPSRLRDLARVPGVGDSLARLARHVFLPRQVSGRAGRGTTTRMEHEPAPDEQSPVETEEGSPVPDPERDGGDADDVPTAD